MAPRVEKLKLDNCKFRATGSDFLCWTLMFKPLEPRRPIVRVYTNIRLSTFDTEEVLDAEPNAQFLVT